MNNEYCKGIGDLLTLFDDSISPAEALTSKLMLQISSGITRERLKLQMNQSDFAKHIGATQSLVSRWEHGDYNFSLKKLAEIGVALNLDVNITMTDISISKKLDHRMSLGTCLTSGYFQNNYLIPKNNSYKPNSYITQSKEVSAKCYNTQTVLHVQ